MIPYDDLVAALAAWRERQGMPVAGTVAAPIAKAPSGPSASSGPRTAPPAPAPAPAARPVAPPAPPPPTAASAPPVRMTPPPLAAVEVEDDALLDEEHYDNEGSDFALSFNAENQDNESEPTAIGAPPTARDSSGRTDPAPNPAGKRGGKRNNDW